MTGNRQFPQLARSQTSQLSDFEAIFCVPGLMVAIVIGIALVIGSLILTLGLILIKR